MLQKGPLPRRKRHTATEPFEEAGSALQSWSQSPQLFTKILVEVGWQQTKPASYLAAACVVN
jgi:hypothetical protein